MTIFDKPGFHLLTSIILILSGFVMMLFTIGVLDPMLDRVLDDTSSIVIRSAREWVLYEHYQLLVVMFVFYSSTLICYIASVREMLIFSAMADRLRRKMMESE